MKISMDENELGRIWLRMSKYGYVREWVSMDIGYVWEGVKKNMVENE